MAASVFVPQSGKSLSAVVAGTNPLTFVAVSLAYPSTPEASLNGPIRSPGQLCAAGAQVAKQMGLEQGTELVLASGDRRESCRVASFRQTGGPEDDRVAIGMRAAQRLADLPGRIRAIVLIVPGAPGEIQSYIAGLQRLLPDVDVRPIRQFTECEAKI